MNDCFAVLLDFLSLPLTRLVNSLRSRGLWLLSLWFFSCLVWHLVSCPQEPTAGDLHLHPGGHLCVCVCQRSLRDSHEPPGAAGLECCGSGEETDPQPLWSDWMCVYARRGCMFLENLLSPWRGLAVLPSSDFAAAALTRSTLVVVARRL